MDLETLKIFYDSMKGYAMMITDIFDEKAKDFQYILQRQHFDVVIFGLACGILLNVKENIVEGVTESFTSKIFEQNLIESVKIIAQKQSDGFYIDNHRFKDAASVVGEIRNAIAHGSFKLDIENTEVTLFIRETDAVKIDIIKFSKMIASCFKYSLKNPREREFLYSEKVETNRTKPFKNKAELDRFAQTFRVKKLTLKRKDGKPLDKFAADHFEAVFESFKQTGSLKAIEMFENKFPDYTIEVKQEKPNYQVIKAAFEEVYANINNDMLYEHQVDLLLKTIEAKRNPEFNLANSLLKNLGIASQLKGMNITDKASTLQELIYNTDLDFIGYNELAGVSLILFMSIFSYGNDALFKELDYEKLDLQDINTIYIEVDNEAKTKLDDEKTSTRNDINDLNKKRRKTQKGLEKAKNSGSIDGINNLTNLLTTLDNKITLLTQKETLIDEKLQFVLGCKSKARIINGIRNCIAHGSYKLVTYPGKGIYFLFEDIHNGKTTFKCEVDMIDFINMMYNNQQIIIDFINLEEQKLVRKKPI